jgi:hypothetical protein
LSSLILKQYLYCFLLFARSHLSIDLCSV